MRTRIFSAACLCILTATIAAAADPWNQKKASEWTTADAQLVITRSPWAIPTKLKCGNPLIPCGGAPQTQDSAPQPHAQDARPITPPPIDPGAMDPTPVMIPGMGVCVGSDQVCHPPDADKKLAEIQKKSGGSPGAFMTIPASLQGVVIVLWESAAPVRAAKLKLGLTDTTNKQAAGSYVVSVIGYPMQTAIGQELDLKRPVPASVRNIILQSGALVRKGKHPLEASNIEVEGTANALNVRYFFPLDASISASEKSVQFRMQVALGDIVEADFSPKTMVYEGKSAISDYPNIPSRP